MRDIQATIDDYCASCKPMQQRIAKLSAEISAAKQDDLCFKALMQRRYILYGELAEMRIAIRDMREYLACREKVGELVG